MRQRGLLAGMLAATALMNLTSARAAATTAIATEVPPTATEVPPTKMRVTALFVPAPAGILHSGPPGAVATVGSEPAFGFATAFDFVPHPHAFVGFGASYTFNVVARGTSADPATAFDLTFRVGGIFPIGRGFAACGYVAPGYSFMRGAPQGISPQGPIVGVHAGALFDVTPTLFLAAELGYQDGFQRAPYDQMDIPFDASFFQTGIGLGVRI
jgi:hypothetical protein